ncbi:hypothetical protein [Saccharicrinis aurantiacus]|uniref:hypothetical protein n=1 Tax=Saccharicrinis aurantiacus TaxID=1849719 RepID=UPI002492576E|nr:hypothetical protein [Saccharicrinis aurantiacus]
MSVFTSILQKTSSLKNLLVLFVCSHLVLLLMMLFIFPSINAQIGTKAFDLQTFGYSASVAASIVDSLNAETTQLYLFPQLLFLDLLYPILLALLQSSLLFRVMNTNSKLGFVVLLIPFLAMASDYIENILIILMILKAVELSEAFVFVSSSFTLLKGLLTSVAWIAILIGFLRLGVLRIYRK